MTLTISTSQIVADQVAAIRAGFHTAIGRTPRIRQCVRSRGALAPREFAAAVDELIPEGQARGNERVATFALVAGCALMLARGSAFG